MIISGYSKLKILPKINVNKNSVQWKQKVLIDHHSQAIQILFEKYLQKIEVNIEVFHYIHQFATQLPIIMNFVSANLKLSDLLIWLFSDASFHQIFFFAKKRFP